MPILSDYDLWKLNPPWVWDDNEPPDDPFMDWAEEESERQSAMCVAFPAEGEEM